MPVRSEALSSPGAARQAKTSRHREVFGVQARASPAPIRCLHALARHASEQNRFGSPWRISCGPRLRPQCPQNGILWACIPFVCESGPMVPVSFSERLEADSGGWLLQIHSVPHTGHRRAGPAVSGIVGGADLGYFTLSPHPYTRAQEEGHIHSERGVWVKERKIEREIDSICTYVSESFTIFHFSSPPANPSRSFTPGPDPGILHLRENFLPNLCPLRLQRAGRSGPTSWRLPGFAPRCPRAAPAC
jgi:hypothetical protein